MKKIFALVCVLAALALAAGGWIWYSRPAQPADTADEPSVVTQPEDAPDAE